MQPERELPEGPLDLLLPRVDVDAQEARGLARIHRARGSLDAASGCHRGARRLICHKLGVPVSAPLSRNDSLQAPASSKRAALSGRRSTGGRGGGASGGAGTSPDGLSGKREA